MITLHHLEKSRSHGILWLLEELGCEYQLVQYARDPSTFLAPAGLKRVHPLGKAPVITDGAHTVAESGAVIEYLLGAYGGGRLCPAAGTEARLRYTYWLHYAEGSAMPPLVMKLVFQGMAAGPAPFFVRPLIRSITARVQSLYVDPQLTTHVGFWEDALTAHPWFAGEEFSAADILMSFPVEVAGARSGVPLGEKVRGFLARIHARPAYQRAVRAGGGFPLPG